MESELWANWGCFYGRYSSRRRRSKESKGRQCRRCRRGWRRRSRPWPRAPRRRWALPPSLSLFVCVYYSPSIYPIISHNDCTIDEWREIIQTPFIADLPRPSRCVLSSAGYSVCRPASWRRCVRRRSQASRRGGKPRRSCSGPRRRWEHWSSILTRSNGVRRNRASSSSHSPMVCHPSCAWPVSDASAGDVAMVRLMRHIGCQCVLFVGCVCACVCTGISLAAHPRPL
eukprot:COSAG05_NODE_2692_length_2766_cov_1.839895_3_plen_228_part_00